jgi:glutamine synthetase
MTTGNAYESKTAEPIPTDLRDAIELARGSDWLRKVIGDDLCEIALQQSERELELFSQQVTAFELDRYRDVF